MLLAHTTIYESIAPWVAMAVGFVAVTWLNRKSMVGDALAYLKEANEILAKENSELKKERSAHVSKIQILEQKTDWDARMREVVKLHETHERRAEARFDGMMKLFSLIAKKLGAEDDDLDAQW